jgi:hypothetical protein
LGKTRNKNRSELEFLKGEVRRLKRHIKQLEKSQHMYEDIILNEREVEVAEVPIIRRCESCGKGKLKEFNLLDRIFIECDTCDYRERIKNG